MKVRTFLIVSLAALGAACDVRHSPGLPSPTPTLASIQLHYSAPHVSVDVGNVVGFTLYAINSEGVFEDVSSKASWVSVNPEIAAVTPRMARGQRAGNTDIVASYGGFTAMARIVVAAAGQNTAFTLQPASNMAVGETSQARAIVRFGSPNSVDVTDQALWSSSDPLVLTAVNGRIASVAPGTAAVSASYSNATATYYVSVPPPQTLPR